MTDASNKNYTINQEGLPEKFPTHRHQAAFWESIGRAVATFGFLEEVLGKAIFALTATRSYDESEVESAYEKWLPKLEHALFDPLGNLIDIYEKAVREHQDAATDSLDELLEDLRKASKMRNVLCHGSWRSPNDFGASLPLFVNRQKEVFDTEVDCAFIDQVQEHAACLACEVINTVTQMGFQFPGSAGPGVPIWKRAG
jgi:hypothetical protein